MNLPFIFTLVRSQPDGAADDEEVRHDPPAATIASIFDLASTNSAIQRFIAYHVRCTNIPEKYWRCA